MELAGGPILDASKCARFSRLCVPWNGAWCNTIQSPIQDDDYGVSVEEKRRVRSWGWPLNDSGPRVHAGPGSITWSSQDGHMEVPAALDGRSSGASCRMQDRCTFSPSDVAQRGFSLHGSLKAVLLTDRIRALLAIRASR